jgi:hypothetical protein
MFKSNTGSPSVSVSYSNSSSSTNPTAGALTNSLTSLSFSDATTDIANGTTLEQTISSISIANNEYIFIRFIHSGGSNSDNLGWDDVTFEPVFATPTVSTPSLTNLTTSNISTSGATLNAEITSDGGATVDPRGFNYGTSVAYGTSVNSGTGTGQFNTALTGLDPNTKYYYQAYATNANGTATLEGNFTTTADKPSQTSSTALQTSFSINGITVSGNGSVTYRLDVSTTNDFLNILTGYNDLDLGSVINFSVTGIQEGTTYYYRLRAVNADNTSLVSANSAIYSVTTLTCTEPTIIASSFNTTLVKDDKIGLSWVNGNGTGRLVMAKAGSAITPADLPVDGISYNSSTTFGSGNQIGDAYVVYKGTATSLTVNNLTGNTVYYFAVIDYDCTSPNYLTSSYASINATTEPNALIRYSFTGAAGNELTFVADAQPTNATASVMSRGAGNSGSNNLNKFSASGFSTTTIDLTDYFSFSVSPSVNYKTSLTKIELDLFRSGTGPQTWALRSSLDNFAADLTTIDLSGVNSKTDNEIVLSSDFSDLTTAVEFRIYGFAATGAAGTGQIDNVQVFGSVTALPPSSNTTVQFLTTTLKVNEAAGTASVDLVISGESATVPTNVDVVLTSGSAADISNFTTQTITFPAGSATNQTATFTLTDDALNEGTETLGFELQNVMGGNAAAIGTQNTFSLKIIDNEIPDIYINEFHYNDAGFDEGEFVEVVLPATFTDLGSVSLSLYDGTSGAVYGTHSLSTFTTNNITYGNYKVYYKQIAGLENGPDGFSLDYDNQLIEFITYGNALPATPITATAGPAVGIQGTDTGFAEDDNDVPGTSLFLTQGSGARRSAGSLGWVWDKQVAANTMGTPNTNQPLPVELISFKAIVHKDEVELNWATATEKNADRFEVERSANGKDFEKIATVKAAGNSTNVNQYKTTDANPLSGVAYYRLKQVDMDGSLNYSDIIKVDKLTKSNTSLYPNPATDNVTFQLTESADISIMNMLGQEVLTLKNGKAGKNELNILVLPAGNYQVVIKGSSNVSIHKMVKLRN